MTLGKLKCILPLKSQSKDDLFIHSFTHSFLSFIYSFVHSFFQSFIHSFMWGAGQRRHFFFPTSHKKCNTFSKEVVRYRSGDSVLFFSLAGFIQIILSSAVTSKSELLVCVSGSSLCCCVRASLGWRLRKAESAEQKTLSYNALLVALVRREATRGR